MFDVPILYIVFNRIDTVRRTFPRIREIKPKELYVAADGPRAGKEGERELCNEVRDYIVSNVDWECNVHTLFRNENLGCGRGVSGAITWFFDNVDKGIVLEDDCLPDLSFFQYCKELLAKYENEPLVMHIAGDNPLQLSECKNDESYYFDKLQHCWGWASWSRAWKKYDFCIRSDYKKILNANNYFSDRRVKDKWIYNIERIRNGKLDTWDYQWSLKIFEKDGRCIVPCKNLVQNVGMNSGVHYSTGGDGDGRQSFSMDFPLKHPSGLDFDYDIMKKSQELEMSEFNSFKQFLMRIGIFYFLKKLLRGD